MTWNPATAAKAPKTEHSRRTNPLVDPAVALLRGHRRHQAEENLAAGAAYADQDYGFADEIGDPLEPPAVSGAFERAVRASGLPKITPHGLRHTFATVGRQAGVDVLYVAGMLGHSSPAITMSISACPARAVGAGCEHDLGRHLRQMGRQTVASQCSHGDLVGVFAAQMVSERGFEPLRAAKLTRPST